MPFHHRYQLPEYTSESKALLQIMDVALSEALRRGNPVVFFDISIGGVSVGRLRLELFKKDCPRTVENFR